MGVVIASTALSYSLINHEMNSVVLFGTIAMASFSPVLISDGRKKGANEPVHAK